MEKQVSVGQWLLYIILANLPFINIISILVWLISGSTHPSVKSWAKAQLIIGIIQTIFCIFLVTKGHDLMRLMV